MLSLRRLPTTIPTLYRVMQPLLGLQMPLQTLQKLQIIARFQIGNFAE
jgi:hypothetical protein